MCVCVCVCVYVFEIEYSQDHRIHLLNDFAC